MKPQLLFNICLKWEHSAVNGSLAEYFTRRRHVVATVEGFLGCNANIVWASVEALAEINALCLNNETGFHSAFPPFARFSSFPVPFKDSVQSFVQAGGIQLREHYLFTGWKQYRGMLVRRC